MCCLFSTQENINTLTNTHSHTHLGTVGGKVHGHPTRRHAQETLALLQVIHGAQAAAHVRLHHLRRLQTGLGCPHKALQLLPTHTRDELSIAKPEIVPKVEDKAGVVDDEGLELVFCEPSFPDGYLLQGV